MPPPEPGAGPIHPAALDRDRLRGECEVKFTRRSGPGGQNRNKVETAVVLRHRPTGLVAEASERRTQGENGDVALFRLRLLLALRVRHPRRPEGPGPLWNSRVRGGRIVVNPAHDDFPSLLAEALDVVADHGFDLKAAAEFLGCSTSQLLKFLKEEPRAMVMVNEERDRRGLGGLR